MAEERVFSGFWEAASNLAGGGSDAGKLGLRRDRTITRAVKCVAVSLPYRLSPIIEIMTGRQVGLCLFNGDYYCNCRSYSNNHFDRGRPVGPYQATRHIICRHAVATGLTRKAGRGD
jgi:hypothetical protein